MRKTLLAIAALACIARTATALSLTADTTTQQKKVSWGFKASYTFAQLNGFYSAQGTNYIAGNDNLRTPGLDVFAEIGLGHYASLRSGISYICKGGGIAVNTSNPENFITSHIRLNYIEVPLNLLYNIPLKAGKIFIGAGPYVSMCLSGNSKTDSLTARDGFSLTNESIKFGNKEDELKQIDYGINSLLGFHFNKGLEISGGVDFGMSDITNLHFVKTNTRTISASIGYFF